MKKLFPSSVAFFMPAFSMLAFSMLASPIALFASSDPSDWMAYKAKVIKFQQTLPGWCSAEKSEKLMDLILDTHPTIVVEIGVFAGSSVYPMAKALRYNNHGIIYAIDPWSEAACIDGYAINDPNAIWWSSLNFNQAFNSFCSLMRKSKLETHCRIIRARSQDAVDQFEDQSIDILHIDGSRSQPQSMLDVINYLPKVKSGGYIWFEGSNWPTTQKAIEILYNNCEMDQGPAISNSYYLFRKF